ncbi:MAG: Hsp20/alpha crystallin family protein [Gemmataceae bacterium]
MVQSRWETYNPLWNSLRQLSDASRLMNHLARVEQPSQSGPALNVWEDGEHIHVTAEVPGLALEDLEVYVTGNSQLTIKGEVKQIVPEKAVRHRQERPFGKFVRSLTLPFAVDPERVEAKLEHGVLVLKLAKHESAKPRKIPVKGA